MMHFFFRLHSAMSRASSCHVSASLLRNSGVRRQVCQPYHRAARTTTRRACGVKPAGPILAGGRAGSSFSLPQAANYKRF